MTYEVQIEGTFPARHAGVPLAACPPVRGTGRQAARGTRQFDILLQCPVRRRSGA
jgi:hypothetical protein